MKVIRLLTSKTVLGVIAAVAGHLAAAPDVTLPVILPVTAPDRAGDVIEALGPG